MTQEQIIFNINTLFAPLNLKVDEIVEGAQNIKYKLNIPLDLGATKKLMREEKNIRYTLPAAIGTTDFIYGRDEKSVYIEMRNDCFNVVNFNDLKSLCISNSLNLILGADENGKPIYTDLSKAPHILVGGTTGSGKSELLHTFIASLIVGMPYTGAELLIIDPKRAEYAPYKNRDRIILLTEMNIALKYLNYAVTIMEKRYQELEAHKAKDIYKYSGDMDMHPIVIIIDELADLIQTYPEVEKPIVRIAQKARACGIHLIIGTQSPRRNVVTGLIQTNMPTKIALHTADQIESRIILGRAGAEHLLGKGDMLFHANGAMSDIRVQSAYVDESTKLELASTLAIVERHENESSEEKQYTKQEILDYYKSRGYDLEASFKRLDEEDNKKRHQKPQRIGFIQRCINLWNTKPIMFRSDDYPPKI